MLSAPSISALNSSTRWRNRARSFSSISADNRVENGERAAQRKQDQRQVARRRRVRRLDQRVVDGRDLLLRLLLRDVGGNRLRPGLPSPPRLDPAPARQSAVAARHCGSLEFITRMPAATRRWLPFVVAERRRSSSSLRATTSSRAATRSSSSFEVAPQNDHRRFDFGQRRRAERGALEGGAQRFEAGHLDGDGGRDLAVLGLAGRSQHRRRGGGDPLGLARQLQRRERRRHPILGDALDDVADLEEGIQGSGGRKHREGADPEKSEQQAAAYAEAIKHRCARGPDRCCQRFLHGFASRALRCDWPLLLQRHVLAAPPDIPYSSFASVRSPLSSKSIEPNTVSNCVLAQ